MVSDLLIMETKEYIVILNTGFNYNEIWTDIESPTSGLSHIPDRAVSILNNHDAFDRMCAYALTDEEAELLKQDPRIAGIEMPIEKMPGVEIGPFITQNLGPISTTITRSINWTQDNGDFTLFVEGGNFTGWIGDITKSNILIDANERSNIINNSTVRQGFRDLGNILGISIIDADITSSLNSVVDDFNSAIDNYIGPNTQAVCLAGQPTKFTTQTSFIQNNIQYTRTTRRVSQLTYGINFSGLPPLADLAEQATVQLVNLLAANGYIVTSSQRSQLKSTIIGILQLIVDILRSISDQIDLYDYTESTQVTGNFNKPVTGVSSGTNINWGLIRHNNSSNVYGNSISTNLNYNYGLDGTGVDIVISDSGIQADHPEFTDSNGVSRVQQINWASYVPALSTMPSPYQDLDGHGTHVAGTAAGKTYGWAKNARIYSIIATGLNQPSPLNQFAAIKLWHQSKNGSRPTVVNMSWGVSYRWYDLGGLPSTTSVTESNVIQAMNNFLSTIRSINYKAVTYIGNSNASSKGLLLDTTNNGCINSFLNGIPAASLQVTTALEDLINSGVIVVHAAGNNSYKIDKPLSQGGTGDYDNFVTSTTKGNIYYHMGSSPTSGLSICVGNIDSNVNTASIDQKASGSSTGPGVDINAAGTNIMSSTTSITNATKYSISSPYFLNNTYRQLNISGTSMASPQVAGMCALYLQRNPKATPAEVKAWITKNATGNLYSSNSSTDYTNFRSLLGGPAKVAYQSIKGLMHVKDSTGAWKQVKAVWVNDNGTWKQVNATYHNINGTWTPTYTG